jgi:hypothetical protein
MFSVRDRDVLGDISCSISEEEEGRLRSIRSSWNDMWGTEVVSGMAGAREKLVIKYGRPMWGIRSAKH